MAPLNVLHAGVMWDLPTSSDVKHAVEAFFNSNRVVAAVCHGPAAFVAAVGSDGKPIVSGRKVGLGWVELQKTWGLFVTTQWCNARACARTGRSLHQQ